MYRVVDAARFIEAITFASRTQLCVRSLRVRAAGVPGASVKKTRLQHAGSNQHARIQYNVCGANTTLLHAMEALTCETVRGGGHLPFHLPLLATLRGAGF